MIKVDYVGHGRFNVWFDESRFNKLDTIASWLENDVEHVLRAIILIGFAMFTLFHAEGNGNGEDL